MKQVRLSEIADIVNGYAFPHSFQGNKSGEYPFFKVGDMNSPENTQGLFVANNYVSEADRKEMGLRIYPAGTLAFPKVGGALLTNKRRVLGVPGTFDNNVMGIIAKGVHPRWLFHWFSTIDLATIANIQALPSIRKSDVEALEVPYHSFERQPIVAAELDSQLATIEEARQAAQRRVKAAEALEAALFREVFQGITPVVIGPPLEPAPAGWSWQRLSTLADLESGHTPSRRQPEWWGGDIPWIALPDIRALDGKVAMETKGYTNPLGIKNSSARILPKDTVVFGRDVQVGFTTIMGRPMATSQHFFNWICASDLAPRFLMQALRASKTYMETKSSGAIHQTIYMPAAREFHVCLPTRKQQDQLTTQLDARLTAATEILIAARAELKAIQSLPAAALRRVFS
jgi:type I restriction enzyme S subunit